ERGRIVGRPVENERITQKPRRLVGRYIVTRVVGTLAGTAVPIERLRTSSLEIIDLAEGQFDAAADPGLGFDVEGSVETGCRFRAAVQVEARQTDLVMPERLLTRDSRPWVTGELLEPIEEDFFGQCGLVGADRGRAALEDQDA